jgi:hypothetical protein
LVSATATDWRSTSERSVASGWPALTRAPRSTSVVSMTPITGLPTSDTRKGSIRQPNGWAACVARGIKKKAASPQRYCFFIAAPVG